MASRATDQTPSAERRWMGVGRSANADSRSAGAEAARLALNHEDPQLLMVFGSITHDPAAVLEGIGEVAPGVPLIGCSTHGEIGPNGPSDGTVLVAALGGSGFSVASTAVTGIAGRQRQAGAEVATCVAQVEDRPYRVLLLLTDGLVCDQEDVLRGAYGVLGASVPLCGGAAGDGWRMERTYQLHNRDVLNQAVVGAVIASDAPLSIGVRHGWRKAGDAMIVTHTADGRVYSLDDEPALDVYLRRLGAPAEVYADPAAFSQFALSRPLGVQRRSGVEVRNLSTEVDLGGRSLGGGGDIRQGGLVWAMEGNEDSVLDAVDAACQDAIEGLGEHPPVGLLTFSCSACRAVLGEEGIQHEGKRLTVQANGAPFAGFYTYGEIARTKGIDGFHSQTSVVLAVG